jgi:tetratricopeptide (TPR) repeat protein
MKLLHIATLILINSGAFVPSEALAEPKQLSAKERSEAAAQIKIAEKFYKFKQYEEALSIYSEVYTRTEDPSLLYGIAQCQQGLGKNQEAANNYQKFLDAAKADPRRGSAEKELAALQIELAKGNAVVQKETPIWPYFYGASALSGVIGLSFGVSAVRRARLASDLQDEGADLLQVSFIQNAANRSARRADVCFVLAAVGGIGGYVISKKEKEAKISLSPSHISLSVSF